MPIEQMNISISPQMARFIRGKVKKGEHTAANEVVRDEVRRLQADAAGKKGRALTADFEALLPQVERDDIRRSVQRGIKDMETGRFEDYAADGLRGLGNELVAQSVKKQAARTKAK